MNIVHIHMSRPAIRDASNSDVHSATAITKGRTVQPPSGRIANTNLSAVSQ
jgi:hypothetical protein